MSRHLITLNGVADRTRAMRCISQAPYGTRVELKAAKRSLDQNSKLWASLTDVSHQLAWHGQKLTPNDWKFVFIDALKRELRIVPNIDGNGFVNLGRSSSDLSKAEMGDLITIIDMFAAKHGVIFSNEKEEAA